MLEYGNTLPQQIADHTVEEESGSLRRSSREIVGEGGSSMMKTT